jgi:hypothetical protein
VFGGLRAVAPLPRRARAGRGGWLFDVLREHGPLACSTVAPLHDGAMAIDSCGTTVLVQSCVRSRHGYGTRRAAVDCAARRGPGRGGVHGVFPGQRSAKLQQLHGYALTRWLVAIGFRRFSVFTIPGQRRAEMPPACRVNVYARRYVAANVTIPGTRPAALAPIGTGVVCEAWPDIVRCSSHSFFAASGRPLEKCTWNG